MSKVRSGWVFRVEVVTLKPSTTTKDMMEQIRLKLLDIPDIEKVNIRELYEDIELFKKKQRGK